MEKKLDSRLVLQNRDQAWGKMLVTGHVLQSREQAGINNRCRVEWEKGWTAGWNCRVESRQVCGCRVKWKAS
jgi:hypothetical protein